MTLVLPGNLCQLFSADPAGSVGDKGLPALLEHAEYTEKAKTGQNAIAK